MSDIFLLIFNLLKLNLINYFVLHLNDNLRRTIRELVIDIMEG